MSWARRRSRQKLLLTETSTRRNSGRSIASPGMSWRGQVVAEASRAPTAKRQSDKNTLDTSARRLMLGVLWIAASVALLFVYAGRPISPRTDVMNFDCDFESNPAESV